MLPLQSRAGPPWYSGPCGLVVHVEEPLLMLQWPRGQPSLTCGSHCAQTWLHSLQRGTHGVRNSLSGCHTCLLAQDLCGSEWSRLKV